MDFLLLKFIIYIALSIPIVIIDIRKLIIPDSLNYSGIVIFSVLNIVFYPDSAPEVFIGILISFGIFWILWRIFDGKMGLGDAKYSALLCVFLGIYGWIIAIVISSVIALSFALFIIFRLKLPGTTKIPFAPFLSAGGVVSFLLIYFNIL